MSNVILKNLTKKFKEVTAVDDVNIEIKDKEFAVLVGPSGCGKTTTLRAIAGLEEATSGEIYIGDKLVNDVQPKDRDIAMVFQNYALYPHMDVYNNMAFGLKLRKFPKKEIDQRVQEAAEILGIENLLKRKPKQLSGGQRQQVAVGRAIVRKPKVFLFDEPLSNLDAKLRVAMRAEISKLHRRLEATIIYVTHDQVEAMWGYWSDKLAVGDKRIIYLCIGVLVVISSLFFSFAASRGNISFYLMITMAFLLGVGGEGWEGVYFTNVVEVAGDSYIGIATGLSLMFLRIGMLISPPIFGYIADLNDSYQNSWFYTAILFAAAVLIFYWVTGRVNKNSTKRQVGSKMISI